MNDGMSTYEITGSDLGQRSYLSGLIGLLIWKRLDGQTWNVTVPDEHCDTVNEWAEERNLPCRLI